MVCILARGLHFSATPFLPRKILPTHLNGLTKQILLQKCYATGKGVHLLQRELSFPDAKMGLSAWFVFKFTPPYCSAAAIIEQCNLIISTG